jgi:hypothetical protein
MTEHVARGEERTSASALKHPLTIGTEGVQLARVEALTNPPILAEPCTHPWCAMVNTRHTLVLQIMVQPHTWMTHWQASHHQSCQCSPMGSLITLWLYLSAGWGIANMGSG